MLGSQPLPPPGESYVILKPDGTFEPVHMAPGQFTAAQEVAALRRRRLRGWLARCWRTPRGQVWFDPAPLLAVGRVTLDDYQAAGRALAYRCSMSARPAEPSKSTARDLDPVPLPLFA